jgi:hypothetical protein
MSVDNMIYRMLSRRPERSFHHKEYSKPCTKIHDNKTAKRPPGDLSYHLSVLKVTASSPSAGQYQRIVVSQTFYSMTSCRWTWVLYIRARNGKQLKTENKKQKKSRLSHQVSVCSLLFGAWRTNYYLRFIMCLGLANTSFTHLSMLLWTKSCNSLCLCLYFLYTHTHTGCVQYSHYTNHTDLRLMSVYSLCP